MMRQVVLTGLALACPLAVAPGDEKNLAANDGSGLVKVEVIGKLVRKEGHYCVRAKNPTAAEAFLVELVRTEDKNRELDQHLQGLESQVVVVRGVLRFSPGRLDGPQLGVPIRQKAQVQKAGKE
jgi:hypothetical protein